MTLKNKRIRDVVSGAVAALAGALVFGSGLGWVDPEILDVLCGQPVVEEVAPVVEPPATPEPPVDDQ